MKKNDPYLSQTINYYNKTADDLVVAYEHANMSDLHTCLLTNLRHGSKVLDIGFGSGRDLFFLEQNGYDIWGVDPSHKFVKYAKKRFSAISDHFFKASLPDLIVPKELLHSFDSVILIAVWMHLPKEIYEYSIKSICSLLKPQGKIILSYSVTHRMGETERYFENVDGDMIKVLFEKHGCTKTTTTENKDGLGEREIIWVTEVYCYDQF